MLMRRVIKILFQIPQGNHPDDIFQPFLIFKFLGLFDLGNGEGEKLENVQKGTLSS